MVVDYEVPAEFDRQRLDRALLDAGLELSRSQIHRLIREGRVELNGLVAKKQGVIVREGDWVRVHRQEAKPSQLVPQDIPLEILFEDEFLIVVNKPAGLVVHPAPGHPDGTLVNALLFHCVDLAGIGGEQRPGIVHRLDKDTSGVMVVAKDERTHRGLVEKFQKRDLDREYIAFVNPGPKLDRGVIETLHGRHPVNRKKFTTKVKRGKEAITAFEVRERFSGAASISCRLKTGRTHQIRVHCSESGFPILGDPVYGGKHATDALREIARQLDRQALHAHVLGFEHPQTREALSFQTELPKDMAQALLALSQLGA